MKLLNFMFIAIGILCAGVGMIGILVPVLPTTPFLILASVCFVKGSHKFDKWFKATKLYKNYAEDFVNDRAMTFPRKVKLMLISDFMLLIPFIKIDSIYLRVFIIVVVIAKYWYFIFKIETKTE